MTTSRISFVILTAAALCIPCYMALGGGDHLQPPPAAADDEPDFDSKSNDDEPATDDPATDEPATDDWETDESQTLTLGRTVRLEFKLVTPEDQPTFPITCAIKEFSVNHDISEPEHEHSVKLSGTLAMFDDQGRVLLAFEATTSHSDLNEGFDATFQAQGSAILEMGKETTLATLGDSPLKVTATVDN